MTAKNDRPIPTELAWLERLNGFLLVDKPEGITSQDVITRLQKILIERSEKISRSHEQPSSAELRRDALIRSAPNLRNLQNSTSALRKRDLPKMGHGGTLDPFATGLLVLAVGDGTKLARYLIDSEKIYAAEVCFGAKTASGDRTNEITERTDHLPESHAAMVKAAETFVDTPYHQLPPMYSAKKIEGKRLYEFARQGKEVERESVECRVHRFTVGFPSAPGTVPVEVHVSPGTFVRTLAEDWAKKLGTLAHLTALRRLGAGPFRIENAVTIDRLAETADWTAHSAFIPFDACLREKLPSLTIDDEEGRSILEGRKEVIETLEPRLPRDRKRTALYDSLGLRAVFAYDAAAANGRTWDFERVFPRPGMKLN